MISSTSNVQIKQITALLKKSKERKEQKAFVIEGRKMFEEICQDSSRVIKAYFSDSYVKEQYANKAMPQVPYEIVADSVFDAMAETVTPQGVLAIVKMPEYSLENMIADAGTLVLLENLRDPGNLGTIIRTAEAAGAHGIIIPKRRSAGLTSTVYKTSAGAVNWLKVARVSNLVETINDLKKKNIWVYGAEADGQPFHKADLSGAVALVIGSEGFGLGRLVRESCDMILSIDMYGKVNSLNASVSGGILMYEVVRHRR